MIGWADEDKPFIDGNTMASLLDTGSQVYIKFTVECPDSEGSIPFLDTKCSPYSNHTIHTTVYRKPTYTDRYLDWNSNHPISTKGYVIQALTHRAIMVCSTPELLAKEMDYLHKVFCRKCHPDCFLIKKTLDHK